MRACVLALWSDSLTFTVVQALAFAGHEVTVNVADPERDAASAWSLSPRIREIPGAAVVHDGRLSSGDRFDLLIVQGHPLLLEYSESLGRLAPLADRLTAISAGDRSRPPSQALLLQARELRWYGRWFRKVDRVAYKDGYRRLDLFGALRPRRVIGFDAHSKFLRDRALFERIHAQNWDSSDIRPIRANFLGSRDPMVRARVLDSVKRYFEDGDSFRDRSGSTKKMYWHAYSDAQPAALDPADFIGILESSDFTLAPRGYSLVTHRPVEALLRGSVPVISADELDIYDLGLVDGVNCIAVAAGRWPAAMERILAMSEQAVSQMRRNVRVLVEERVRYAVLSRDISRRLGLPDA